MRKLISALIVTAISAGSLFAAENHKKTFDYRSTKLDNGLTVITLEDFSAPIVAVQVWYHVGSKDEDPNRQGFAHMFEHMMFRGSQRTGPEEHFSLLRSVGGRVNGYTSFDKTVYLETLPAEQLELALWLEAERMAFLDINQENFDTERKVVEEELRMKLNKPYGTAWEKLFDNVFDVHPYQWMPIGQISHLRASTVGELRDFWMKYYGPQNATLIIVGAVEHEKALELSRKNFEWIDSHKKPEGVQVREPVPNEPREIIIDDERAPAPVAGIGWLTVPSRHEDSIVLELLASIWGEGDSSIIYKELVETRMSVGAEAGTFALEQAGLFGAGAALNPNGCDPNKVISVLEGQIAKIRQEGVSEADLEKAKNQMLRDQTVNNLSIENKAKLLGYATLELGDTSRVNTINDEIRKVTVDDIKRVAKKYLTEDKVFRLQIKKNITGPFSSKSHGQENSQVTAEKETVSPEPARGDSKRPDGYPEKPPIATSGDSDIAFETKMKVLENGLKVMVVPNSEVPFVTVHFGSMYGGWSDEKPGTSSMAMSLLDKGTKNYSAQELALELDKRAISLNASGGIDNSSVSVSSLSNQAAKAVELMAEVIRNPVFAEQEFEKQQEKLLTSLAVESQSPEYIADKYFRKAVYGEHPYSRTATGDINDVKGLSAESCKGWWSRYLNRPEDKTLIFAGDIEPQKAFEIAQKHFGDWKSTKVTLKKKPEVKLINQPTHVYLIDNPGSVQTQIRVGQLGITRKQQPEYFTSRVVSDYFGFGFNSRLNRSIRVDKGLTYAVWGGFFAKDVSGEFKMQTFSKTETTHDAVKALIDEVVKLKNIMPTSEELAQSKSYIAGSFVLNRETPQQVAQDLWLIESEGLKKDYLDRLLESVRETDFSDCMNLVSEIDPEKMVVVVVGDAQKLKGELEQIGPVTVIEDEF